MRFAFVFCLLTSAALGQVKLPPFQKTVLPNGVILYAVPRPGVPLAGFRIVVKGGMESEPKGSAGIATVTADLLRKGTAKRSANAFSDELDFLGGTFRANVDEQATFISSEFLKKDFAQGLELTADAVLHPAFPGDETTKLLSQRADAYKSLKDNPQAAIAGYYRAFFYGSGHPYGRPADELSMAAITREGIADYHRRQYVGRNMIVVITGDFEASAVMARAGKVFGAVPAGDAYVWAAGAAPAGAGKSRLLLVDKPDATQTYFWIGQPGIDRRASGRTTVGLLNTLFGGRFTSMLNDELRVNSGLTYGASSRTELNRLPGSMYINTYTKTETTEKAMDLALEVLQRLNTKGITAAQLASVKAYEKGMFPTRTLETPEQIATQFAAIELFELNRGEVDDLFSRIDSVTVDAANSVARQRFQTGNLTFVVVGNAAKIRDQVKKYAPQITEVSIKKPGYSY